MSSSSLSLHSLNSFTTVCQSNGGTGDYRPRQHHVSDGNRRRFYGNINMQLNSTRMLLSRDHIASQMREPPCSAESGDGASDDSARSPSPTQTPQQREADPPPTRLPSPCTPRRRGSLPQLSLSPTDTRRHGIILDEPPDLGLEEEEEEEEEEEDLPRYAPIPYTPFRRVTPNGTLSAPIDARTLRSNEARQRELRELQRQWTVRRRTHPVSSSELARTEPTRYRPLVSQAFDLPPPYAPSDPYPLYSAEARRRPSRAAKVLLLPFGPGGKLLERAAAKTDQWAAAVTGNVKTGVRVVGDRAKAVPKRFEARRALRKMRWLETRGMVGVEVEVEVGRERERERERERGSGGCSVYAHVCDVHAGVA